MALGNLIPGLATSFVYLCFDFGERHRQIDRDRERQREGEIERERERKKREISDFGGQKVNEELC